MAQWWKKTTTCDKFNVDVSNLVHMQTGYINKKNAHRCDDINQKEVSHSGPNKSDTVNIYTCTICEFSSHGVGVAAQ